MVILKIPQANKRKALSGLNWEGTLLKLFFAWLPLSLLTFYLVDFAKPPYLDRVVFNKQNHRW